MIAVVGMSTHPEKEAHAVPLQLLKHGWTVIPVHPWAESIAGQQAYAKLAELCAAGVGSAADDVEDAGGNARGVDDC